MVTLVTPAGQLSRASAEGEGSRASPAATETWPVPAADLSSASLFHAAAQGGADAEHMDGWAVHAVNLCHEGDGECTAGI